MNENTYIVYVKTDEEGRIRAVDSNYNNTDFTDWTQIDEGTEYKHSHAMSNYLGSLYTDDGIPRYKLVDGKAQERTEEEIQADRDAIPEPVIPPTNAELEAENKMLRAQLQAATDRQDFIEDCIAEMAMVVYAV